MDDLVHEGLLEEVKERLEEFQIDGILDSGMLEQLTEDVWYSPFPQYQTTERPDRAVQEILKGKVVILCDNSPEALILPGNFSVSWRAARTGITGSRWLPFSEYCDIWL